MNPQRLWSLLGLALLFSPVALWIWNFCSELKLDALVNTLRRLRVQRGRDHADCPGLDGAQHTMRRLPLRPAENLVKLGVTSSIVPTAALLTRTVRSRCLLGNAG